MKSKSMLTAAFKATKTNQAQAAAAVGWVPQQLSNRLTRESLKADEFLDILDKIGVEVTMTVRETGNVIFTQTAHRRVKGMVKGEIYDTASAGVVASTFYYDGVNEYGEDGIATELCIDSKGRYFFVDYCKDDPDNGQIRIMAKSFVDDFIDKYKNNVNAK